MEDQKTSAVSALEGGTTLLHRKAPSYITEYVDRTVVLLSDAAGSVTVNLVFGRDTAEIKEEKLISISDTDKVMTPGTIETFRLDLASISLPAAAAKAMAEGILRALESVPQKATQPQ